MSSLHHHPTLDPPPVTTLPGQLCETGWRPASDNASSLPARSCCLSVILQSRGRVLAIIISIRTTQGAGEPLTHCTEAKPASKRRAEWAVSAASARDQLLKIAGCAEKNWDRLSVHRRTGESLMNQVCVEALGQIPLRPPVAPEIGENFISI